MMDVVLDEMPQYPPPREEFRLAWLAIGVRKGIIQVRRGHVCQGIPQNMPRFTQATDQLGSAALGHIRPIPCCKGGELLIADAHRHMTPTAACANDMQAVLADASKARSRAERQHLLSQRRDRCDEELLVRTPAGVQAQHAGKCLRRLKPPTAPA